MVTPLRSVALLPILLLTLASCATSEEPSGDEPMPQMEATRLLIRASLDLRGVRPSLEELDAVTADPASLDGLLASFLEDSRFPGRAADLLAPIYRTRVDFYNADPADYGLDPDAEGAAFHSSIGEELLQMVATVAEEDLPYTDLVTSDWSMANEILAKVYPTDYPEGGTGWKKIHYTDDRPAAGALAANSLWWRYPSATNNYNRQRANALSRIFLCNDYLTHAVDFSRTAEDATGASLEEAVVSDPGCVNCHASLDPLASYLYGFWYFDGNTVSAEYHPEREQLWRDLTGVSPAYYGEEGYGLADLGRQIASDNRYVECAVQSVYEAMLRRDSTLEDTDALTAHREAFLTGGLTLRSLFRSVLDDARYRAGDTSAEGAVPFKMASPELLASQVEDLTGYRMKYYGYDMMQTDYVGLRSLAGGVDGYTITRAADRPTASLALVQERLAEGGAAYVVSSDVLLNPAQRRLFGEITFAETPDTGREAMVAQIQSLHRRIFGNMVTAEGEEVAAALALWSDLYTAEGDIPAAWMGLLSFLLRDPDFLLY